MYISHTYIHTHTLAENTLTHIHTHKQKYTYIHVDFVNILKRINLRLELTRRPDIHVLKKKDTNHPNKHTHKANSGLVSCISTKHHVNCSGDRCSTGWSRGG